MRYSRNLTQIQWQSSSLVGSEHRRLIKGCALLLGVIHVQRRALFGPTIAKTISATTPHGTKIGQSFGKINGAERTGIAMRFKIRRSRRTTRIFGVVALSLFLLLGKLPYHLPKKIPDFR